MQFPLATVKFAVASQKSTAGVGDELKLCRCCSATVCLSLAGIHKNAYMKYLFTRQTADDLISERVEKFSLFFSAKRTQKKLRRNFKNTAAKSFSYAHVRRSEMTLRIYLSADEASARTSLM